LVATDCGSLVLSNIQLDLANGPTRKETISAGGSRHSLASLVDGTVVAWGGKDHGELMVPSGLSDVVAIVAGYFCALALRHDGCVIGWRDPAG
jgi:hypothetical protein